MVAAAEELFYPGANTAVERFLDLIFVEEAADNRETTA